MSDMYESSGVNIKKGEELVDWLKKEDGAQTSKYGEVVSGIGGFASLFRPNFASMKDPLIVSGTDGIGTKILLGVEQKKIEGLGVDLVAMCLNDLYTLGAEPLFFIDYYGTGVLDDAQFKEVLTGIKKALFECNCLLLGGETAELPGLYDKGHFDMAGFVVGVVDGANLLGPSNVRVGDKLVSIESSGFHSNGYSLIRKIIREKGASKEMIEHLIKPTKLYHDIPKLVAKHGNEKIHACANITGGGISGNLPRVMPKDTICRIDRSLIKTLDWMKEFIESYCSLDEVESAFNLGVGMIICVDKDFQDQALAELSKLGHNPQVIGSVAEGSGPNKVEYSGQWL